MTRHRPLYKALLILLLAAAALYAEGSGKITGTVRDAGSGELLIGANIILQGLGQGAATDAEGRYLILNVRPGRHTLLVTYIGYSSVTVNNVMVQIDRTTTTDISMTVEAYKGETVTVTAERPIVEVDKTNTSVHYDAEEIAVLPVAGLRDMLELAPGINRNADGTIAIRGGSGYDINYSVNGMTSVSSNTAASANGGYGGEKSDNNWKFDVNPLAVAQIEVISGGFSAEYGNAQSGVVKVQTKEGGETFSGGFRMEYRPAGQYHWGDYLYSKDQPEWQLWGDLQAWRDELPDSLAVRNYNLWVMNHSVEGEELTLYDYDRDSGEITSYTDVNRPNILGVYDYRQSPYLSTSFAFGGPLGADARRLNFFISGEDKRRPSRLPTVERLQLASDYSLTLSFKPTVKHHIKLTGLYQYYESGMGSGSNDVRWAGLSGGAQTKYTLVYDALREETSLSLNLNYKYIFNSRSYLENSLTYMNEELFSLQTPVPGIDKDAQLVSQGRQEERLLEDRGPWFTVWDNVYRDYFTWSSLYNQASFTDFLEFKSIYTNQITPSNLLKTGFQIYSMDQDFNASSSLTVSSFIHRTGFASNYQAKSLYAAAFVQDKIEFAGMVANLGLRMDAYNMGGQVPVDWFNLFYPAENEGKLNDIGIPEWENSRSYLSWSPRIGLSFPISDRTAFRVQYGHFRAMPRISQTLDNATNHGWSRFGNPDLEPTLSVNYEMGLQQSLWGTHQLDIVTYYNDRKNQVNAVAFKGYAGSTNLDETFTTFLNNGYGSSRGIEVAFANRNVSQWRYRVSYTMSQTRYGYHGVYRYFPDMTEEQVQLYTYQNADYLSGEDRTHRMNSFLAWQIPDKSGPSLLGLYPFSRLNLSLIYTMSSGAGYFWSPDYVTLNTVESNRRYPMETQTDMQAEKRFRIGGYAFLTTLKVKNLFNNRQLTPISSSAELTRWVKRGATYMDEDLDPTRRYHVFNYWQAYKNIPRELYFSLGVDF